MGKHGVFISYRHNYDHGLLAGRIFDYLERAGFAPFLDVYSMPQGYFPDEIIRHIKESPYFLLVLTPGCLDDLNENDWIYKEIKEALECKKNDEILVVATEHFSVEKTLPEDISKIKDRHFYELSMQNFPDVMKRIKDSIEYNKLEKVLSWRDYYTLTRSNVYMNSRLEICRTIASYENCFGYELVDCVKNKKDFTGQQKIKRIRMSCYAATLLLTNSRGMVDNTAFDYGTMFNIFRELLKDTDFSMELILTAPNSAGMKDAIDNKKLGNDALEEHPEAIFLGYYANILKLIYEDPVFKNACREKRFKFMVTGKIMIGAIFQTVYKDPWKEFNNVKVDFYTSNIMHSTDRRCVMIFEENNKENYDFFVRQYEYLRDINSSNDLIEKCGEGWIEEWKQLQEEI